MIKDVSFIIIFKKYMVLGGLTCNGREIGGKGREDSSKNRDYAFTLPSQLAFQFTS